MTTKQKKKRDEYWRILEEEYKRSGLTQKKFCEKKGINLSTVRKHFKARQAKLNSSLRGSSKIIDPDKIDWSELYQDWLEGDFDSLADFARSRDMNPKSGHFQRKTKGWFEKRAILRCQTDQEKMNKLLKDHENRWQHHFYDLQTQVERAVQMMKELDIDLWGFQSKLDSIKDINGYLSAIKLWLGNIREANDLLNIMDPLSYRTQDEVFTDIEQTNIDRHKLGQRGMTYEEQVRFFERNAVEVPYSLKARFEFQIKREEESRSASRKEREYGDYVKAILDISVHDKNLVTIVTGLAS